ncbi:unnamed protein product [Adineta steineri]|uniref:Uncharacterized protein n=2 Tax=Adineta steineri TaxID=433720 RepID=A0A815QGC9_9BILA|nr:unnamed protein product [Adineta steineri]
MKYQRVLYTNQLTAEIKSKFGIVSIDKRLSSKKNVYFVSFASNADMKIADRIAKRIRNITLKPIQAISSDIQYEHRISIHNNRKSLLSSSTSPTFFSPPITLSFLSNSNSQCTTRQSSSPVQQANETLEERAKRILGSQLVTHETVPPIPTLQPPNFLDSSADVMQYQRVLYTNKLTAEIKSKLGIVSIDKRLSSKKDVYFVSFASNADMKIAGRIAKRIRNIALKPIQAISSDNQYEHRINIHNNRKRLLSSSTSPTFSSPTTTLSFLSNCDSPCTTPQRSSPIQQANETLEERAKRILGSRLVIHKTVPPIPTRQPSNFLNSGADVNSSNNYLIRYEKDKKQLIDNVTSCLKTMEIA